MSSDGSIKTDISQKLIDEALRSVDKASKTKEVNLEISDETTQSHKVIDEKVVDDVDTSQHAVQTDPETASLKAQVEFSSAKNRELMQKLKDEHERTLRATADLENYKKRAAKEREETQKYGIEKMLKDFLPVIDNLERALSHAKQNPDFESFKKGVEMTHKQFEDSLSKNGVKGFSSLGKLFDPQFHEAMQQIETDAVAPNHVATEMVRGFTLNERLIRPALVAIAKAKTASAPAPSESEVAAEKPPST